MAYLSDFFFEASDKSPLRKPREQVWSPLQQTIIEAAQFFQIAASKKKMGLELDEARAQQQKVLIRPELLRQIFINFFDNWLKYGLQDQVVHVRISKNKKKELVIEVVGRSIPFDNATSDQLFELGVRGKEAREKIAQGSGIGLFICKEIVVKALHGSISAEHRHGIQESAFRIAIPADYWQ